MSKNNNLHNAKIKKNDEFYTMLSDIENELKHYKEHFKDKVVFCNCDDPEWSNFFKYFDMNFNHLGLKKLITTHFDSEEKTYALIKERNGDGTEQEVKIKKLLGNGDFRNQESIDFLKEADIVVTNPPFSLFREYVAQLVEYNKKFIIWSNNNSITYKEIFPLIKNNKMWLGYCSNKTCYFKIPNYYEKWDEKFTKEKNDGCKYGKVPAISVFTNLDIKKRHEDLILTKHYYKTHYDNKADNIIYDLDDQGNKIPTGEYPKYDNYDAINVDKVTDIPCDYDGVMGVPITFLDKYNPAQFEIVSFRKGEDGKDLVFTRERERESSTILSNLGSKDYQINLLELGLMNNPKDTKVNGKSKYARVAIQRVNQ